MTQQKTNKPYVIVFGNEKGGTGKSTLCMHMIVNLLKDGYTVGSIDVDARQGTLTRYIANREATRAAMTTPLAMPQHASILRSTKENLKEAETEDRKNVEDTFAKFANLDFIVVDTPGNDTPLSRFVHMKADTLITPLNDSFVDLDVLVHLKGESLDMLRPSTYAEMVWEQKKHRAVANGGNIDWIVLRNRLSSISSRNKEQMEDVMAALSKRLGFRYLSGFGERVIFRELFLSGLTLLDMDKMPASYSLSHVAARQELRTLLKMINLPNKALEGAIAA